MSDLINRADAINAFWEDSDIRTAEVRATLKELPSADAVQGEWHKTENDEMEITGYYCSVCDTPTDEPTNYCGNCGAKMYKGGDDE